MIEQHDLEMVRLAISQKTRGWEGRMQQELHANVALCSSKGWMTSGNMLLTSEKIVIEGYGSLQQAISAGLSQALVDLHITVEAEDFHALLTIATQALPAPTTMRDAWLRALPNVAFPDTALNQVTATVQSACERIARELEQDVQYALEKHSRSGKPPQQSTQVIFNGAATVGAIQNGSNMTANVTQSTISIGELATALQALGPLIASSELDSDAKKEHQAFLDECIASAQSGKPNKTKIGAFLGALKGTAEGLKNGVTLVTAATEVYHLLSSALS